MTGKKPEGAQIVVFGEVLFDLFPDGSQVLGGAPFNVAWNLKGLGVEPLFISRVGSDSLGDRIREGMTRWGLDTAGLQFDPSRPTGTVEVRLEHGEPRFDIVADRAYDYIDWKTVPPVARRQLLYHGSLALRGVTSRSTLKRFIARHEPSIFLDVNLRSPWWEKERIYSLLRAAQEVKLNEDELTALVPAEEKLDKRALHLLSHSAIEALYVTRGSRGAVAFEVDGQRTQVQPDMVTPVVDTVGAGDAFSAVLILGRTRRWPLATTLRRAQDFAAAVVGLRGATTLDRAFYDRFCEAWSF
jgi:fructokinase